MDEPDRDKINNSMALITNLLVDHGVENTREMFIALIVVALTNNPNWPIDLFEVVTNFERGVFGVKDILKVRKPS